MLGRDAIVILHQLRRELAALWGPVRGEKEEVEFFILKCLVVEMTQGPLVPIDQVAFEKLVGRPRHSDCRRSGRTRGRALLRRPGFSRLFGGENVTLLLLGQLFLFGRYFRRRQPIRATPQRVDKGFVRAGLDELFLHCGIKGIGKMPCGKFAHDRFAGIAGAEHEADLFCCERHGTADRAANACHQKEYDQQNPHALLSAEDAPLLAMSPAPSRAKLSYCNKAPSSNVHAPKKYQSPKPPKCPKRGPFWIFEVGSRRLVTVLHSSFFALMLD